MKALEQEYIEQLEELQGHQEREADRVKERDIEHSKEMMNLSTRLSREFQESLSDVLKSENKEENGMITWLKIVSSQQEQILQLLVAPPKSKDLKEELEKVLQPLFGRLEESYIDSNQALAASIEISNKAIVTEMSNLLH